MVLLMSACCTQVHYLPNPEVEKQISAAKRGAWLACFEETLFENSKLDQLPGWDLSEMQTQSSINRKTRTPKEGFLGGTTPTQTALIVAPRLCSRLLQVFLTGTL